MPSNYLYGFEEIISFFNKVTQGKMHHAYLICGEDGTGKFTFTKVLAYIIVNGLSVDYDTVNYVFSNKLHESIDENIVIIPQFVPPEKSDSAPVSIGIDEIRKATQRLNKKSIADRKKVLIIENAESLSYNSVNSLLKLLEEPQEMTYILITTGVIHSIIPTLLSRCILLKLRRLKQKEFFLALEQRRREDEGDKGLDSTNTYTSSTEISSTVYDDIYRFSGGNINVALSLLKKDLYALLAILRDYSSPILKKSKIERLRLKNSFLEGIKEFEGNDLQIILSLLPSLMVTNSGIALKIFDRDARIKFLKNCSDSFNEVVHYLVSLNNLHLDLHSVLFTILDYIYVSNE